MTLVSQIISDAYRESNINAIGTSPTSGQIDEALRILNRLVMSAFGSNDGDHLNPVPIGYNNVTRPQEFLGHVPDGNWFVPTNTRLMLNLTSPVELVLSPAPQDGARFGFVDVSNNLASNPLTLDGNGRLISGSNQAVFSTSGDTEEFFYRGDLGNWLKCLPLASSDEFPFPLDFDDYFIVGLAMRINPRNTIQTDPMSLQAYSSAKAAFNARYHQSFQMKSDIALIRLPSNVNSRYWGDSTASFNTGYPYNHGDF